VEKATVELRAPTPCRVAAAAYAAKVTADSVAASRVIARRTTLESMDAAGSRGGSVMTVGSVGSTAKASAGKTSDKRLIQRN
jgi:hypothetical protein